MQRIEAADRTVADIRHGGTRAYYAEGPDYVQMLPFETFRDAESHAATLAHELTHWTKHNKRLARDVGRVRHMATKAMPRRNWRPNWVCLPGGHIGIVPEVRKDHATYIQSWLQVPKDDRRLILQPQHSAP